MTTVSIIICTRNRADELRTTLDSIASAVVPPDFSCDLLVVDNGSTDHTAQVVRDCTIRSMPVRYVHEPRRGQSNARNAGIDGSSGDIILFTDDDIRVPHNWIAGMCQPIVAGRADAVAGGVSLAPELRKPWMTRFHEGWLGSTERLRLDDPEDAVGANMAFSRRVLEKVPAFDPELGPGALGYGDDTLFAWQLKAAGFRVVAALDVAVEHHFDTGRLSRGSWLDMARRHGRTAAYLDYHWLHRDGRVPARWLFRSALSLAYRRLRNWRECRKEEWCPQWEVQLVSSLYHQWSFLTASGDLRKYERRGLQKRC